MSPKKHGSTDDERFHTSSVTNMICYFHKEKGHYSLILMFSFDNRNVNTGDLHVSTIM